MIKYGGDYLGGNKYKNEMIMGHRAGWCGGIFLNTFGYAFAAISLMCRSKKFSEIVVHIAPFDSSHQYPIDKLKKFVLDETAKLEQLSRRFPKTILMLSPFCEHNHSAKNIKPLLDAMKQKAPSCLIVNSIWKGQEVPGYITEIHLPNGKLVKKPAGEYTVSFDGYGGDGSGDFSDADIQRILDYYSDARHIRAWDFRFNGKFGHKDENSVSQRNCWPSVKYIKGKLAAMKRREGELTWPNNALYKTFADDHGNNEPTKDNRAMCILPRGGRSVDVLDCSGSVIDKMQRLDPPHEMGPRYYSAKYAFELGDIAQANTGRRLISIRSGKDVYPLTDADLRSGLFK